MINKIFFKSLFFCLAVISKASTAESGGMPQLNPEFWVSQIFWLTITFGGLYLVLSKLILPKISFNLEARKSQISDNIEAADRQKKESDIKLEEFQKIISDSKIESKNILNEAREKALKNINEKKDILEKQISEELSKAEEEINQFRREAPAKINKIAIESSSELLQKLIGTEVNNSSIAAIVEDLYKKRKDEYYGS